MATEPTKNPRPEKENPFIFNSGNIQILVSYRNVRLVKKVLAKVLVLASSFWRKSLFPSWDTEDSAEKTSEASAKEIECGEDDAEALFLLMNIAHLNFGAVPSKLPCETLFQVAGLVD
jgi:hypothetical protein